MYDIKIEMESKSMFKKIKQDRIYKNIANQILDAIFRGELRPHDKLPSEKELQEIFSVGRVTVREAIQSLEQFGIVEVRQGSQGGAFIREMDLSATLLQIRNALKMSNFTLQQVTEARVVIEENIFRRLIPSKIKKEDFVKLENNIAAAEAYRKDQKTDKWILPDFGFHTALAEITDNPIIILVNKLIHDLLLQFLENIKGSVPTAEETVEVHKKIVELMKKRKFEEASKVCVKHIKDMGVQIAEKSKEQSLLVKRVDSTFRKAIGP